MIKKQTIQEKGNVSKTESKLEKEETSAVPTVKLKNIAKKNIKKRKEKIIGP